MPRRRRRDSRDSHSLTADRAESKCITFGSRFRRRDYLMTSNRTNFVAPPNASGRGRCAHSKSRCKFFLFLSLASLSPPITCFCSDGITAEPVIADCKQTIARNACKALTYVISNHTTNEKYFHLLIRAGGSGNNRNRNQQRLNQSRFSCFVVSASHFARSVCRFCCSSFRKSLRIAHIRPLDRIQIRRELIHQYSREAGQK